MRYLQTIQFGQSVPVSEWRKRACQDTQTILADLDAVIAELQAHRARMMKELDTLSQRDASSADKATAASEPAPELKGWRVRQTHVVEFVIRAPSAADAKAHAHAQVVAMTDDGEFANVGATLTPNVILEDFDAMARPSCAAKGTASKTCHRLDECDITGEENGV